MKTVGLIPFSRLHQRWLRPSHLATFHFSTTRDASIRQRKLRQYVLIGAVGFGLLSVSPLFWLLGKMVSAPPPHAKALQGTWCAESKDGGRRTLRVNSFGMAAYDEDGTQGRSIRGSAEFAPASKERDKHIDSIQITQPWPFGRSMSLHVDAWPESDSDTLILEGEMYKKLV